MVNGAPKVVPKYPGYRQSTLQRSIDAFAISLIREMETIGFLKKKAVSKLTTEFREEIHKQTFVHRNVWE